MIEVFQVLTQLNLTKEQQPSIVVPCAFCETNVYIHFHCKECYSAFYCDKTCLKNHKSTHDSECVTKIRVTPSIQYPLQLEVHCGGDLCEDIKIYYEHEMKFSLKLRGKRFMTEFLEILNKNRWLASNDYTVHDEKDQNCITLKYMHTHTKDKKPEHHDLKEYPMYDSNINSEEDQYLRMPVISETKVLLMNQGGILQDIVKETYETVFHYIHIYYIPV